MKKTALLLIAALVFGFMPASETKAVVDFDGSPDDNPNHFVWSLMSQMQTPDDPDCASLATAALAGESFGESGPTAEQIAAMACNGLATMRTSMQSDMNGAEDESMETNLFDAVNWHSVENLYFKHSTNGVADGRIDFSQSIDFMSYDFLQFMTSFGENMEAERGKISLNADVVDGFANYGATLTMYNVREYKNPQILVNGRTDKEGVVSNMVYDKTNDTIVFNAAHFSDFRVVEKNNVKKLKPKISTVEKETVDTDYVITITGSNLSDTTRVTLNGKSSATREYENGTITATFKLSQVKMGKKMSLKVINSNKKSAQKKITIN